ncbi:serrate RNA effector molecule homolog [Protopterus annectens]|uniref:serrate RNA effector molecule homolog n=1 Tax=Protopterus annectens TaxID=7888 RepID=UPI001CFBF91E|nr:serrate RNA effector molecule homolog [Protopterus annectens]
MGDSDDEYDRRRRDKFRRERSDYDRSREREDRRRDDWNDREWDRGRERNRRGEYRDYDRGRRERFTPPRHDLSPPQKRLRRDWDDHGGDPYHSGYDLPYSVGGPSYGPPQPWGHPDIHVMQHHGVPIQARLGSLAEMDLGPPPPVMKTFKEFLLSLDDSVDETEAVKRYNEYKLDFRRQQMQDFFLAHKEEEWFRSKYHPDEAGKRKQETQNWLRSRLKVFNELLECGAFDNVSLDIDKARPLVKLLDTAVIKLEGGTDIDLKILDQEEEEEKQEKLEAAKREEARAAESEKKASEKEESKKVEGDEGTEDKPKPPPEEEKPKPPPEPPEKETEPKKSSKKRKRKRSGDDSYDEDGSASESDSDSDSEEEDKVETEKDKMDTIKEEKMELDEEEEEEEEKKDKEEVKEPEDKKETEEKVDIEEKKDKDTEDTKETEKEKEKEKEEEKEKPKEKDTEVKPRPLHRTCSLFMRNIAPNISKAEIAALCKRYPGFLRVALSDPQPERRFYRRAWVTFDRSVNIKEICWNLQNIRLRECELSPVVNRDLSRRARNINGITQHKPIVRNDIKLAAKLIQSLDDKTQLWTSESESEEKPQSESIPSQNPILKNITHYLIDEVSAEEEELLGNATESVDEVTKDGNPSDTNVERDEKLLKVLDKLLLYLRIVHSVDYYNNCEYPNEDEMPNRLGLIHVRGPMPPNRITHGEVSEWQKNCEERLNPLFTVKESLSEEEAVKMGKKDSEQEVEKFITANTQEVGKDKWLCPLSGKKFKGPEFVRKHIFNKHGDKIEEVKKEVSFFNNFLMDAKRPSLPEIKPNQPPGPGQGISPGLPYPPQSPQGLLGYGQPRPPVLGYAGGPPYPPSPYGGRGSYDFRGQGFPGKHRNRMRGDPRAIIEYRDLDAPEDVDFF